MRVRSISCVLLTGVFLGSVACGDTNLLDQITARQVPPTVLQEYVVSLEEAEVIQLADEAFSKGWDAHAVGVAILAPFYESKGFTPGVEKRLAILTDPHMHVQFRVSVGFSGLKDRSLEIGDMLEVADGLLDLFEDDGMPYFQKQSVPDRLRERLRRETSDIRKQARDDGQEDANRIYERSARMMSDLAGCLAKKPKLLRDRGGVEYSTSSAAASSLSEYIDWYIDEFGGQAQTMQKHLGAVRDAQRALVRILEDDEYDAVAAHTVLRTAEQSRLHQVLAEEDITTIRGDARFVSDEDQRLLDGINQRILERTKSGD